MVGGGGGNVYHPWQNSMGEYLHAEQVSQLASISASVCLTVAGTPSLPPTSQPCSSRVPAFEGEREGDGWDVFDFFWLRPNVAAGNPHW